MQGGRRRRIALVTAMTAALLFVHGVGTAAAHERQTTDLVDKQHITDEGILAGTAGPLPKGCSSDVTGGLTADAGDLYELATGGERPVDRIDACSEVKTATGSVPGMHHRLEDPRTGHPLFIPGAQAELQAGPGAEGPHHLGTLVTYSIKLDAADNAVDADVVFVNIDPIPFSGRDLESANLGIYLYDSEGYLIDVGGTGTDSGAHPTNPPWRQGHIHLDTQDLASGSYEIVVSPQVASVDDVGLSQEAAIHSLTHYRTDIVVRDF